MTNIKSDLQSTASWTPFIRLDLATASNEAFGEVMPKLLARGKELADAGKLPPIPFDKDGWYEITPEMSETSLMHSGGNRECQLKTVRAYAADMAADDWKPTGESIIIPGKLDDGHNRMLASYLGLHTFNNYVVTSAPEVANRFAYLDSGKNRTGKDVLHIAGWNSTGKVLSEVIKNFAIRYDENKLGANRQPRFHEFNNRHIMNYMHDHPDLRDAVQMMFGTFPDAVEVIRSKDVAAFFGWLVLRNYDLTVLESFCTPLGNGALLAEDSPILAVRNKLQEVEDCKRRPGRTKLAYLCKAFLMHLNKQKMPRSRNGRIQPLGIDVDEPFPRIEAPALLAAE